MEPPTATSTSSKNPKKRTASVASASGSGSASASASGSTSGSTVAVAASMAVGDKRDPSQRNKQRKIAQQTPTFPSSSSSATPGTNPNILRTVHPTRFAQARAFELLALQSTLRRTLDLAKSRAFQKTPRFLRRRAASHNPRKVPRRLRARALRELENDPVTPKKRKPKALRRKPRSDFLRRQLRNGTWLETHLWLAKRFHMRALWGFKLPQRATQKGDRSVYRAAKYASVVHDASYQSVYELVGPMDDVARLVQSVLDPAGPKVGAARYTAGKRTVHVEVVDPLHSGTLLGPATALWRPVQAANPDDMDVDSPPAATRTLWLWTHPAIDERLLAGLAHFMDSQALTSVSVTQVTDLCKLSLAGPKSFGLLHSILRLAPTTPQAVSALWQSLAGLVDPGALPRATLVAALDLWDPRITYPPARPTYGRSDAQRAAAHAAALDSLGAAATAAATSGIWSSAHRAGLRARKPRDHALQARRHAQLVPGTRLTPSPDAGDVAFPLLVFTWADGHGLDLVLPRGFALPLWRSLVWAGARPLGVHEMRSLAHERGVPYFPWDFPATPAYLGVVSDEARDRKEKWERRPKGKRVNYAKLKVPTPFMPEWSALVQGQQPWLVSAAMARRVAEVGARGLVHVQQALQGAREVNAALVHVVLTFPTRGAVDEHALVYAMPAAQRDTWMRVVSEGAWDEAAEVNAGAYVDGPRGGNHEADMQVDAISGVEERHLIGHVTSGRFALSEGRTKALAVVKLTEVVGKGEMWVLVRKTSGSVVYPAKVGWVHV